MMQRLEPYALLKCSEAPNSYREAVKTWTAAGTIRAAVSTASGSRTEMNELLRIESTHTAVTWDTVKAGDRIRREGEAPYEVTYVIDGGRSRMHQLFLKVVEEP